MRINLTSGLVDDQDNALRFYTDVLGFAHPAAKRFKEALMDDGIPFTSFAVEDVQGEYERLRGLGSRSRRSRPRWDRSRPRCSTTPAAT